MFRSSVGKLVLPSATVMTTRLTPGWCKTRFERGDHSLKIMAGNRGKVSRILSTGKGSQVVDQYIGTTARPAQRSSRNITLWSWAKGMGWDIDLPIGGSGASRKQRILVGYHLGSGGSSQQRPCRDGLLLLQRIVKGDQAVRLHSVPMTSACGDDAFELRERQGGEYPPWHLVMLSWW